MSPSNPRVSKGNVFSLALDLDLINKQKYLMPIIHGSMDFSCKAGLLPKSL